MATTNDLDIWYNGAPVFSMGQDSELVIWYFTAMGQYNRAKVIIISVSSGGRRRAAIF
jgi:hypothetical protein